MLTHDRLIKVARSWLLRPWQTGKRCGHYACSVVITDMTSSAREIPDAIGWFNGKSTLVECKVSVEDFKKDVYKLFRQYPADGMGDYRLFMTPKGLLKGLTLPDSWGLIEVSEMGGTRVKHFPKKVTANKKAETQMLTSLICRLNVDPGPHVRIRRYVIGENEGEPRATFTIQQKEDGQCEPVK